MSEFRSPVCSNLSDVQPFKAGSIGGVAESQAKKRERERERAKSPLEQIEEYKQQVLEQAEKIGRERGHSKGFIEGYDKGKILGTREAQEKADQELRLRFEEFEQEITSILEDLQKRISEWFTQSEELMTDLAMDAIRHVLCAELAISRDSALEIVKDALKDVTHSRHARIRVNAIDAPFLRSQTAAIMAAAENLRDIEFISDPSIPAGCIIETDGGVVVATTDTKLTLIENNLKIAS